jgi:large subunit ribosomal protein L30
MVKVGTRVRVTYTKSAIGYARDQKATVVALGLKKLNQTVEHTDTPQLRGMVNKVRHLVTLEEAAPALEDKRA